MHVQTSGTGFLTLGQVAERFGLPVWKIQSVLDRGLFTDVPRLGTYRVIAEARLDELRLALAEAGYLRPDDGKPIAAAAADTGHAG
jgi:hypothetical protein